MPKLKTRRAAAKRFKATASGQFKKNKANTSHILTKKTTKRKRGLRKANLVDKSNVANVKRLLPYA